MIVRRYISRSELLGQRIPAGTLRRWVRGFKRSHTILQLAQMNAFLSLFSEDADSVEKVQRTLAANYLNDTLMERLRATFAQAKNAGRPVFFRQQILALLRMCLSVSEEDAPVSPVGKTDGGFVLGEACLVVSDYLLSEKQHKAIEEGTQARRRKHLAMQMGPQLELQNPLNLLLAIARAETIFSDLLRSRKIQAQLKQKLGGFELLKEFRKATGFSLQRYRDFVFLIVCYYNSKDFDDFITDQGLIWINPETFIRQTAIKSDNFRRFLSLEAIPLKDLADKMKEGVLPLSSLDFNLFRRWPLIQVDAETHICLDPSFLLEKLGTGLRWMVINSFSLLKDREQVLQAFGYLFELYVDRLMREIYPASSNVFFSFSKFQNGDEAFDGVLCLGEHLIVMKYKGGLLKEEAKYSGKLKALEADMDKKFGTGPHGGVRQIVKKLERLFHAKPVKRDRVAQIDRLLPGITKITPVLVVQEPFFRFDFLNEILNQGFGRLMKKGKLKPIEIAPLQVIDIESLERMMPNLIARDFRLDQCLNARATDDPDQRTSFFSFPWKSYFNSYGTRENERAKERCTAVFNQAERKYFPAARETASAMEQGNTAPGDRSSETA